MSPVWGLPGNLMPIAIEWKLNVINISWKKLVVTVSSGNEINQNRYAFKIVEASPWNCYF